MGQYFSDFQGGCLAYSIYSGYLFSGCRQSKALVIDCGSNFRFVRYGFPSMSRRVLEQFFFKLATCLKSRRSIIETKKLRALFFHSYPLVDEIVTT